MVSDMKVNWGTVVVVGLVFAALAGAVYAKLTAAEVGVLAAAAVGLVSQLAKLVEREPS